MGAPLLIAHRGGAAEAPENTLAAFRHALSLGIRWFELDVQMARDGELVVIHDTDVERTTNGHAAVGSLLFEELRRLDAGSWFGPGFKGEVVPTLREVLTLCATNDAGVLVELKSPELYPGVEEKVGSLVGEMWLQGAENIWCISFNRESVARMRALDPSLLLGQLYDVTEVYFADPGETIQATCPYFLMATYYAGQIEEAHHLGKQVFVWTVNEEAAMRQLARLGVDGIISDHPTMLLRAFKASKE